MAFKQGNFAPVGANATNTPAVYSYNSTDTLSQVISQGYFTKKSDELNFGDWVLCVLSDTNALLQILQETSTAGLSTISTSAVGYAEYQLDSPESVSINSDGVTFTPIPNMTTGKAKNFSAVAGKLIHDGLSGLFVINGTSDLEVSKATDITYSLVVDSVAVPSEQTTVSFSSSAKKANISITSIAQINSGNVIEIWAKGSGVAGVTLTVNKLDLTFLRIDNA